ncbi:trichohyalin-like [Macrobrachium rosenbergii]|uniref:trichohyalin-like n=1 Tax=Macrobrachium rosenbergii TaxID=79674 RepID=UPI0034D72CC5
MGQMKSIVEVRFKLTGVEVTVFDDYGFILSLYNGHESYPRNEEDHLSNAKKSAGLANFHERKVGHKKRGYENGLESTNGKRAKLEDTAEGLTLRLSERNRKIESRADRSQRRPLEEAIPRKEKEIRRLKKMAQKLQKENYGKDAAIQRLQKTANAMVALLAEKENRVEECVEKIRRLEDNVIQKENCIQRIEAENHLKEKSCRDVEERLASQNAEMAKLKKKFVNMENRIAKLARGSTLSRLEGRMQMLADDNAKVIELLHQMERSRKETEDTGCSADMVECLEQKRRDGESGEEVKREDTVPCSLKKRVRRLLKLVKRKTDDKGIPSQEMVATLEDTGSEEHLDAHAHSPENLDWEEIRRQIEHISPWELQSRPTPLVPEEGPFETAGDLLSSLNDLLGSPDREDVPQGTTIRQLHEELVTMLGDVLRNPKEHLTLPAEELTTAQEDVPSEELRSPPQAEDGISVPEETKSRGKDTEIIAKRSAESDKDRVLLKEEIEKLRQERDCLREEADKERAIIIEDIQSLEETRAGLKQDIVVMAQRAKVALLEITCVNEELALLKKKRDERKEEADISIKRREIDQKEKAIIKEEIETLLAERDCLRKEVDIQRAGIIQEIGSLEEQREGIQEEIRNLGQKAKHVGREINSITEEIRFLQKLRDEQQEEVDNINKRREEVELLQKEKDIIFEEIQSLLQEKDALRRDIDLISRRREEAGNILEQEMDVVRNTKRALKEEIDGFINEKEEFMKQQSILEAESKALQKQRDCLAGAIEKFQERVHKFNEEVDVHNKLRVEQLRTNRPTSRKKKFSIGLRKHLRTKDKPLI